LPGRPRSDGGGRVQTGVDLPVVEDRSNNHHHHHHPEVAAAAATAAAAKRRYTSWQPW